MYSHALRCISLVGGPQAGERAHERVLDDVLGVVARPAQQAAGEGDEALAVAVVDGGERVVAAGADEGDEPFVRCGGQQGGGHDRRIASPVTRSQTPRWRRPTPEVLRFATMVWP